MDPSFFLPLVLQSAIVPVGIALVVLFVVRLGPSPGLAAPAAVLLAFLASYFMVHGGQWSILPRQALDWVPWIGVLAMAVGCLIEQVRHAAGRFAMQFGAGIAAALMVLWPVVFQFGAQRLILVTVAFTVAIAFAWSHLTRLGERGSTPPTLLTIVAGGSALTLMIDASQLIGQLLGALAMACAACAVFNIGGERVRFSGAAVGTAVVLLGALLLNAYVYAGFSLVYVALLALGLVGGALADGMLRRAGKGAVTTWVGASFLSGLPVLVAIGLALKSAQDSGGY